jgi:hypothetical protein
MFPSFVTMPALPGRFNCAQSESACALKAMFAALLQACALRNF